MPGSPSTRQRRGTAARTTLVGSAALTTAVLPVFLVGALSGAIQAELGIGETAIGAVITAEFLTAAVVATAAGRLTERIGGGTALRVGVVAAAVAAAVIGLFATSWWLLALPMVVAGISVALVDTGVARGFVDAVPAGVHGLAFGIKEASIPAASLLAGATVPTLAATVGWRAAFVATLGLAAAVWVAIPAQLGTAHVGARRAQGAATGVTMPPAMRYFAVGVGVGSGAANAAATFLVPAMTARGMSASAAGLLLVVASGGAITVRLAAGWWADRHRVAPATLVGVMLLLGAAGAAVLVVDGPLTLVVTAVVVMLATGWGWLGLAFFAAVRARPDVPAAASGVILTGLGAGGAIGPLLFGTLAGQASHAWAWAATAAAMASGGLVVLLARRVLDPRS